ncbi:MAG: hypothetical protein SGJ13_14615 [Actinomycetota bacterium]|nr:hypothetical protein [Actinomycetota bacterium]
MVAHHPAEPGALVSAKVLVIVGIVVAAWAALGITGPASPGGQLTADEPQYVLSAISLGEDRDLDIADELAEERYRFFHRANLPVQTEVQDDAIQVSPHDPLLPTLLAAPVFVGGWIGGKLALALLAGVLAAAMVWVAVVRFAVPVRVAVVTVLAFSMSAPLVFYGTMVYPEVPAALAVTLAIAAITGPLERRGLLLAGAAVVALPWLSVKYVPVAAALAVCVLWRRRSPAFAGALAIAGVVFAGAHLAWYGGLTPYATGDHFVGGEFTAVGNNPDYLGRSIRLVGLLLDRDFGLVAWQPAFLLALPAAFVLVRQQPRSWWVLAIPFAAGWFNAAFIAFTMHGWWWPGRQTVVILPCVVVTVAWWAATRPYAVRALGVLGGFGASVYAWLVAQAAIGDLTIVTRFETISYPLVNAWRFLLPDYRELDARDWALHAVWLTGIALLGIVALARPRLDSVRQSSPSESRIQGATST